MSRRSGFTLVELVVVVMILGILAAVAAPKLIDTSGTATDNGLKQTLAVVRDAIERHAATSGGTPPTGNEAAVTTALEVFLRGPFPSCPVGAQNAEIEVVGDTGTLTATASATKAWKYSTATGDFIVNSNADTISDASVKYEEL